MLREGGAPPALQVGGAMMAGMVAPGGPTLSTTQRALAAPGGLVRPFTQEGREVIVGNVLRNLATDPDRAIANLRQAQTTVPGVRVTTAAGARDPGLAAAETPIRALDQSGAFPSILTGNQQALMEAYRRISGRPGSIERAETKRSSITALNGVEAEQTLKTYGPAVDRIMARKGDKYFEHEMAVNQELQPVKWDAQDVWIRSIADVLIVDGRNAYCLDYKTGKIKDDPTQLRLFAAMVFWHFPEVTQVKTSYIWLKFAEVTNEKHQRNKLGQLWASLKPRFDHLQATYELGVYKTKPGPLCDPWCPARHICPDAKLKRK
jgi:hypothetical protein